MTIAVLIKVNDGIVLASDSATTFSVDVGGVSSVQNIYNSANKIFNLHKQLPIGAMTWGQGNIGPASIASVAKDLRSELQGDDPALTLDRGSYTVDEVARRARDFLYDGRYQPIAQQIASTGAVVNPVGFLVAGYSSGADTPAAFSMSLGTTVEFSEVLAGDTGVMAWGQPEAVARILNGISLDAPQALLNGVPNMTPETAAALVQIIQQQVTPQMVAAAMPIQDAIDLANFLVMATIQYVRFVPGHPTVGGPVEVATITKHEGFKWVQRKHFYEARLNPTEGS